MTSTPEMRTPPPAAEVRISPFDTTSVRRQLHRFPELGFLEIRTADLLWRTLTELGWSLRGGRDLVDIDDYAGLPPESERQAAVSRALKEGVPPESVARFGDGGTAFVAELHGSRPGPTVGLRLDMDALPVTETSSANHAPTAGGFASAYAGVMHACGHDGHLAIGLRLAAALARDRDFPGRVRLLFQPAEEGVRGAAPMVASGLCDGIDRMLAVHLGFGVPEGSVGYDMYATTKFRVDFIGRAAHASRSPEEGRNALLAAAVATTGLHSIPRFAAASTRVNVGALHAAGASNIVAERAVLAAEIRANTTSAHDDLKTRALAVVEAAAHMNGVEQHISYTGGAMSSTTDISLFERILKTEDGSTATLISSGAQPLRASDDASLMMSAVQQAGGEAAYLIAGSGTFGPHHSPTFDFLESALTPVADMLTAAIHRGL